MKTSISHLPESKQQELQRVVQLIVETVVPEKIILFGSYATGNWVEDRYTEGHITYEYLSDYDILVVTKTGERKKDYEITDQIKNRLRFRVPINVITHDIDYVNKKLSEGQYFFTDIVKEGILLYDVDGQPFAEAKELSKEERKKIAEEDFSTWFTSAKNFHKSAIHAVNVLNADKEAVFLLHQSAERLLNTIILVFTGYKQKTHNLDKLRGFAKGFSKELYEVFPCNTTEEEWLFSLLQRGYIDARYNKDYHITQQELALLIERVGRMIRITEQVCSAKIGFF
jgi:predicted nucleotidyltransferase/HEPN domain-containing protein